MGSKTNSNLNKKRKPNTSWTDTMEMSQEESIGLNSTTKDRSETVALIDKYKNVNRVDELDLRNLMIGVLEGQLRTSDQIASLKHSIRTVRADTEKNAGRIDQHDLELDNLRSSNLQMQSDINILKQKEFDSQVILSGFPDLPNEPVVLQEIVKKFGLTINDIIKSDVWVTNNNNRKHGFMSLVFASKSAQIKFMKSKIANGPVYLSELCRENIKDSDKIVIFFNNRLSPENRDIHKKIRQLLKDKKIFKSRFRNSQFEIQLNSFSQFQAVPSIDFLQSLVQ